MKKYILAFLTFVSLSGCVDVNSVISPGDKPVIEAYLVAGSSVKMHVFSEIPYSNSTDSSFSVPIDGLSIIIEGNDGRTFTLTSVGEGLYTSASNERIGAAGSVYSMKFAYNGRTVSATTTIPPPPDDFLSDKSEVSRTAVDLSAGFGGPPPGGPPGVGGPGQQTQVSINFSWLNPNTEYHFLALQSMESNPTAVVTLPADAQGFGLRFQRFTNSPTLETSNQVQVQTFEYFGRYAAILYRVNPDYAALYETGGTTTQNIQTPVSLIENGLGIFTGIGVDTVFIKVSPE